MKLGSTSLGARWGRMGATGLVALVAAGLFQASCNSDAGDAEIRIPDKPYATLSEWKLFADLASLTPAEGVVPYDMASPLFTDYATKPRFMFVPEGEQIAYSPEGAWQFPVGTILIKTFAYLEDEAHPEQGERMLETRLMLHTEHGWEPEVYVWNDAQTDAERDVSGASIEVTRNASDGEKTTFEYSVPSRAECRKCHGALEPIEGAQATRSLGPMTPQLNTELDYGDGPENQIDHLASLGLLDTKPRPADERLTFASLDDESASLSERVRAYLHSNCAHCHSEHGEVFDKELWLDWASTGPDADPYVWGVCKKPTSAGNADCESEIDIVPGDPDASLMVCRLELLGKGQMAPLGRNLVHTEAAKSVRQWIAELDLPGCRTE